jgi:hypothetical protein
VQVNFQLAGKESAMSKATDKAAGSEAQAEPGFFHGLRGIYARR